MTRDDIIRTAKEAGLTQKPFCRWGGYLDDLMRFAALVAAAEREVCAEVAESYEPTCDTCPSGVANAIGARGEP